MVFRIKFRKLTYGAADTQKHLDAYADAREFLAITPLNTQRLESEAKATEVYERLIQIPQELRTQDMQRDISRLEEFMGLRKREFFQNLEEIDSYPCSGKLCAA